MGDKREQRERDRAKWREEAFNQGRLKSEDRMSRKPFNHRDIAVGNGCHIDGQYIKGNRR